MVVVNVKNPFREVQTAYQAISISINGIFKLVFFDELRSFDKTLLARLFLVQSAGYIIPRFWFLRVVLATHRCIQPECST